MKNSVHFRNEIASLSTHFPALCLCIFATFFLLSSVPLFATNSWSSKSDFGGYGRSYAAGFGIGNKVYIGTGSTSGAAVKDFWVWDAASNTWTQKADFGGGNRASAVAFAIGDKGYIGTGDPGAHGSYKNDLWEYDTAKNTWTQKTNYPGSGITNAVGFSIGDKGYIGLGSTSIFVTNAQSTFYEYDPSTDSWSQKASFKGGKRLSAVGFSIGSFGYVGTGEDDNYGWHNDFWQYNPSTDTWKQRADFGGSARGSAAGFAIGSKGYIGTGVYDYITFYSDFYEYNPATDTWKQKTSYAHATSGAVGVATCTNGYIGTGTGTTAGYQTFEEYTPSIPIEAKFMPSKSDFCIGDCISLSDSSTNSPTSWKWTFSGASPGTAISQNPSKVCYSSAGIFTITLVASNKYCTSTKSQTIAVESLPTIAISPTSATLCSGDSVKLTATGAATYAWSPTSGLRPPSGSTVTAKPITTTSYTVTGTTAVGCINTASIKVTVNQTPTVIVSPLSKTLCQGESVQLAASGASIYSWSPLNGLSSGTDSSVTAKPSKTITYIVTGTDAKGCLGKAQSTITVTPLPKANAGLDASICIGKSTTLHASGGSSYSWYPTTGLSDPKSASPIATPSMTITYTVTVTNGACPPDTDAVTISVLPLPPTPTISANGSTLASSATIGNQWYLNGKKIDNATSQFYTITQSGFYSVCVTGQNGCSSCSTPFSYSGISQAASILPIELYPNPTSGTFIIHLDGNEPHANLRIFSLVGQCVYAASLNARVSVLYLNQPIGTYILKVQSENCMFTSKLIIQ